MVQPGWLQVAYRSGRRRFQRNSADFRKHRARAAPPAGSRGAAAVHSHCAADSRRIGASDCRSATLPGPSLPIDIRLRRANATPMLASVNVRRGCSETCRFGANTADRSRRRKLRLPLSRAWNRLRSRSQFTVALRFQIQRQFFTATSRFRRHHRVTGTHRRIVFALPLEEQSMSDTNQESGQLYTRRGLWICLVAAIIAFSWAASGLFAG